MKNFLFSVTILFYYFIEYGLCWRSQWECLWNGDIYMWLSIKRRRKIKLKAGDENKENNGDDENEKKSHKK